MVRLVQQQPQQLKTVAALQTLALIRHGQLQQRARLTRERMQLTVFLPQTLAQRPAALLEFLLGLQQQLLAEAVLQELQLAELLFLQQLARAQVLRFQRLQPLRQLHRLHVPLMFLQQLVLPRSPRAFQRIVQQTFVHHAAQRPAAQQTQLWRPRRHLVCRV